MIDEHLRGPVEAILLCPGDDFKGHMIPVQELLDHIAELTRQLEDARRLAVCSGIFQDHRGEAYEFDGEFEYSWRADPVGPVAWDRQGQ